MEDLKKFLQSYAGAIIGAIIAIIILCTRFYEVVLWIIFIVIGIWTGNYIQHNKTKVKENIKNFIDKL